MTLMLNLLLGHLLGDFMLQPGWLVSAKREGLGGLLSHVSVIVLATGIVLVGQLAWLWSAVLLTGAAHLGVEVVTIAARRRFAISRPGLFIGDQVLHFASLAGIALLAGPVVRDIGVTTLGFSLAPSMLAPVVGVVAVVFLGAILVFEVDVAAGVEQRAILPYDGGRIAGMAERAACLAAAVAIHPAFALAPFVPRLVYARTNSDVSARRKTFLEFAVGFTLCMAAYCLIIAVNSFAR